jgi:hypothetical protein
LLSHKLQLYIRCRISPASSFFADTCGNRIKTCRFKRVISLLGKDEILDEVMLTDGLVVAFMRSVPRGAWCRDNYTEKKVWIFSSRLVQYTDVTCFNLVAVIDSLLRIYLYL